MLDWRTGDLRAILSTRRSRRPATRGAGCLETSRGSGRCERRAGVAAWIVAGLLAAAGVGLAGATADTVVVEHWDAQPAGQNGVPDGWQKQSWGSPRYDFTIVSESGERAIRLRSSNDSSTINKELKIDVREWPILQWRWKAVSLPKGEDARRKQTDDQAAAGSTFPSQKVGNVTFVVIRSGDAELNTWLTETRNVLEDYRRIYGEAPKEDVGAVSISINSQNTGTSAESFFGGLSFTRK